MSPSREERSVKKLERDSSRRGYRPPTKKQLELRAYYVQRARAYQEWLASLPEEQRQEEEARRAEQERQGRAALRARGGPGYPPGYGPGT